MKIIKKFVCEKYKLNKLSILNTIQKNGKNIFKKKRKNKSAPSSVDDHFHYLTHYNHRQSTKFRSSWGPCTKFYEKYENS